MKAKLLTLSFGLYLVLVLISIVTGLVYFILGERLLRRFRARYPEQWRQRGEPTFISFAVLGKLWWRPISADNFFRYEEYRAVGDAELTRRGNVVRILQRTTSGVSTGWLVLGFLAIAFL